MRIISRTTDLEGGIVLAEASGLDRIALLEEGYGSDDLDRQGPLLVRRYAEAAREIYENANHLGPFGAEDFLDVEDLLDTWAHWVGVLAARWHRGDPLAMSPFRSTALKALAAASDEPAVSS